MKTHDDCIPCYFKQVLSIVQKVTDDEKLQSSAIKKASEISSKLSLENSPAENIYFILKEIHTILDCTDPFKEDKIKYNRIALDMYPQLQNIVRTSKNPLYTATQIAAAGNIIDLGIQKSFNITDTLNEVLKNGFGINHFDDFKKNVEKARNILYLLDNTGEIVFDKILIEQIKSHNITVVVNEGPILNDATYEDAILVGLDKIAKVITTGTDTIGKIPERSSSQFKDAFYSADLIIAKGHANYEILNETNLNIFFILRAKCDVVAQSLGVKCGESALFNPYFALEKQNLS
ncbi:MAG: ARMT1-like domain-containing protein [Elusimicrobia bacterium]|nr:ARMT1-like domain-containing protein [Elusimicrobiota bacterium]